MVFRACRLKEGSAYSTHASEGSACCRRHGAWPYAAIASGEGAAARLARIWFLVLVSSADKLSRKDLAGN